MSGSWRSTSTWLSGLRRLHAGFRHWQSLSDGFLVCLLVVAPSFLFEELWRGQPMIDQGGAWWLIPAIIMAVGFFAGDGWRVATGAPAPAPFARVSWWRALTLVMIFLADLIRRGIVGKEVLKVECPRHLGGLGGNSDGGLRS